MYCFGERRHLFVRDIKDAAVEADGGCMLLVIGNDRGKRHDMPVYMSIALLAPERHQVEAFGRDCFTDGFCYAMEFQRQ